MTQFFQNIPQDTGMTFVVVQHLSPDHKSLMGELLSKKTELPVVEVTQDALIKRDTIFIIPPTKNLVIAENHLKLLAKPTGNELNLPIDIFLESLAKSYGAQSVGVILSGTGSDGTKGVWHVKEHGGLVIAQRPEEANFGGMPQSVINTGLADYILPVGEMYGEMDSFFSVSKIYDDAELVVSQNEIVFTKILNVLKKRTELDFNLYKKPTLIRRMSRRLQIHKLETLEAYLELLEHKPEEIDILYKEFLIGVTKFFRDEDVWETVTSEAISEIVNNAENNEVVKVWDVGCSTGEEAYSVAMLFMEEAELQHKQLSIKVFATDISQVHLDIASKGMYNEAIASHIPVALRSKYFTFSEGMYKAKDFLRRAVIFSNHNIIKDPPFNNIDLVICRNLLIYFQPKIQNRVLKILHYSLKLDGFLFLGSSENLGSEKPYYQTIHLKHKLFKNIETSKRLRAGELHHTTEQRPKNVTPHQPIFSAITANKAQNRIYDSLGELILEQLGATTFFIDADYTILKAKGNFGDFAKLPTKGFSTSALKMLPVEFKIPLTNSIKKLRDGMKKVAFSNILFKSGDEDRLVDLLVMPVPGDDTNKNQHFAVTLLEKDISRITKDIIDGATLNDSAKTRIKNLEAELDLSKEKLLRSVEETETSNEELQATNEELLASNEELQSTNEELQSVNEELHTVNAEHVQKVEELALLNADMDNLLATTEIGVLYLDDELKIRKFTPSIHEHFNIIEQDIGRHIDNFNFNFQIRSKNTVSAHAKKVLQTGRVMEKKIVSKSGKHFLKRITPFASKESNTEGVVITFINIDRIITSQNELKESQMKFKDFYESDPIMHVSVNPSSGNIVECNELFVKTLGYKSKKDIVGRSIYSFYSEGSKIKASILLEKILSAGDIVNEELTLETKEGNRIPVILNSNLRVDSNGVHYTRSTLVDISKLKAMQQTVLEQKAELERANRELEQFVSICSHDLQEPLSTIKFGSDLLRKKFNHQLDDKGNEYVNYIYESSGRLANQIKALLEHTRIGQNLNKELVDTKEIVEIVLYDLGKSISKCGADIKVGKLPTLNAYKTELRLLFQNLIGNALKYCKKDETPKIRINAFEDGDFYIFSIKDNGIGMKEEDQSSIFTIFNRVPTEDKYEGTGVGLAHCEKIIKLHGGTIWVDSEYGEGSTFYFKLERE